MLIQVHDSNFHQLENFSYLALQDSKIIINAKIALSCSPFSYQVLQAIQKNILKAKNALSCSLGNAASGYKCIAILKNV